jgi:hypothetical protein
MNGLYVISVVQAITFYFILKMYWSETRRTKKRIQACVDRYNLTLSGTYETWRLAVEVQVSHQALDALKNRKNMCGRIHQFESAYDLLMLVR